MIKAQEEMRRLLMASITLEDVSGYQLHNRLVIQASRKKHTIISDPKGDLLDGGDSHLTGEVVCGR